MRLQPVQVRVSVFVPQNLRSVLAKLFRNSFSMCLCRTFMSQPQFCSKHLVLFALYPVCKGFLALRLPACISLTSRTPSERTKQHRSLPQAPRTVYEISVMNVFRGSFLTNTSL